MAVKEADRAKTKAHSSPERLQINSDIQWKVFVLDSHSVLERISIAPKGFLDGFEATSSLWLLIA